MLTDYLSVTVMGWTDLYSVLVLDVGGNAPAYRGLRCHTAFRTD